MLNFRRPQSFTIAIFLKWIYGCPKNEILEQRINSDTEKLGLSNSFQSMSRYLSSRKECFSVSSVAAGCCRYEGIPRRKEYSSYSTRLSYFHKFPHISLMPPCGLHHSWAIFVRMISQSWSVRDGSLCYVHRIHYIYICSYWHPCLQ